MKLLLFKKMLSCGGRDSSAGKSSASQTGSNPGGA